MIFDHSRLSKIDRAIVVLQRDQILVRRPRSQPTKRIEPRVGSQIAYQQHAQKQMGRPSISTFSVPPSTTFASSSSEVAISLVFVFSSFQIFYFAPPIAIVVTLSSWAGLQMYAMLAISAVWTEASHVEFTERPTHVSLVAFWTLLAEASVVVIAQRQFRIFLDMNVEAFVAILTITVLVEELTFAHLA